MTKIKIIKNWDVPNLIRQTSGGFGRWEDVEFLFDSDDSNFDYLIVLNFVPIDIDFDPLPGKTWAFMQEPFIKDKFDWVVEGHEQFDKVFTHHTADCDNKNKYFATQTCLPWHIGKTYDELMALDIPIKSKELSWITSNKTTFPGHLKRMQFYTDICDRTDIDIDIFGFGINEIADKWEGLGAYKYSIAVENSSSEHYWTEKVSDCLLSYTLPFYFGCTNLKDYLPEESYIQIDIKDIDNSVRIINDAIKSKQWEKRLVAIAEARRRILNEYQFFPFVVNQVKQEQS